MEKFFNLFRDNVGEICLFIVSVGFATCVIIYAYYETHESLEERFVSYYKENRYVLNECLKYEEKLKKIIVDEN